MKRKGKWKEDKSRCYVITGKHFWLDYPNERAIKIFSTQKRGDKYYVKKEVVRFIFN